MQSLIATVLREVVPYEAMRRKAQDLAVCAAMGVLAILCAAVGLGALAMASYLRLQIELPAWGAAAATAGGFLVFALALVWWIRRRITGRGNRVADGVSPPPTDPALAAHAMLDRAIDGAVRQVKDEPVQSAVTAAAVGMIVGLLTSR